jgi:hypothetical protein
MPEVPEIDEVTRTRLRQFIESRGGPDDPAWLAEHRWFCLKLVELGLAMPVYADDA